MGRAAGTLLGETLFMHIRIAITFLFFFYNLGNYINSYLKLRSKRDVFASNENIAEPLNMPNKADHVFHGGERALLYGAVEDFLSTFGVDGKACLLRLICEVHSRSLNHFGLFGEMVKLFFT